MGKRSRESQRRRRGYKKRTKYKNEVRPAANELITTSVVATSESSPFLSTDATTASSSQPGPHYNTPLPTASLATNSDVLSPCYSQGSSISPGESDIETRKRHADDIMCIPRLRSSSNDERSPPVTMSCTSLIKELNETKNSLLLFMKRNVSLR